MRWLNFVLFLLISEVVMILRCTPHSYNSTVRRLITRSPILQYCDFSCCRTETDDRCSLWYVNLTCHANRDELLTNVRF